MNKYLLRGLILIATGVIIVIYGMNLMADEKNMYKIVMSLGVILLGIGIVTAMYSLFRKIDRRALQQERRQKQKDA